MEESTETLRAELEERLRFETILAETSAHFVNLPAEQIDGEIESAQRRICEFLNLDRSSLGQVLEQKPGALLLTHIHQPHGGPPAPERPNARDFFPWTTQRVLAGETIVLTKMSDLPPEAGHDRESYHRYGTKSVVVVPLSIGGGPPFGLLTFSVMREERDWPETVVKGFQLIAQVFSNALARKRADRLLRESEEVNRATFDQAAVGIAHVGIDGRWLRVNDKLCAVVGYPREELLQLTFQDITHPDDLETDLEFVRQILSGEIKTYSMEKRYFRKDRSLVWVNLTVSLVRTAAGEPQHFISVVEDITERKLTEQALEERLRFERLVSNLSARFVNIPPDGVDSEIEGGLREILEFFQVDRCGLLRMLRDKASWQITHIASSDDIPPVPVGVELLRSIYPWAYEKLVEKHDVVSISRLDDLPAEANVDRQSAIEWGFRSYVNVPIVVGESADHIIHVSSVKNERVWPQELFPRLQLLGEIFVNALERKKVRMEIEERLRFEGLLADLSGGFVNLPPDQVDREINKGLRSITEFFDADRCNIGLFSEDGTQLAPAFQYHSAGSEPAAEAMSKEQMPWYIEQLIRGNPVVMNRVEDLPPKAEKERELCLAKGMKSVLSVPMVSGGKTLGACALVSTRAERVWTEELIQRFRLISEIFVNALEGKWAEEASRESERILRQNERDLRTLAGRLIYAQEEERRRLARELHDDLAQRLAVFAIDVGGLEKQSMDLPASAKERLQEMEENIVKLSQDVHNLSRQLHPSILDDLGLVRAVESECMNFSRREGIEVVFNHENISRGIPKDVSLSLYRIVQEGLRNISKHACAEHISVSLKGIDQNIMLSVQDDGIGFDWEEVQRQPGLGFSSMRERARLIHGELSIQSQPEKGTMITLRVPLTKEGE